MLPIGDQQTYKLIKDLQTKIPVEYNCFYAMPGDWHLMKLTAELIKSIIWDGGFKEMCIECGDHKDLTQWQDIHLMLSALHEVLLRKCTTEHEKRMKADKNTTVLFWNFVTTLANDTNTDEVSRFWAGLLKIPNT